MKMSWHFRSPGPWRRVGHCRASAGDTMDAAAVAARCAELKAEFPFQYQHPPEGKLKTQSALAAIYEGLRPIEKDLVVATGVGDGVVASRRRRPTASFHSDSLPARRSHQSWTSLMRLSKHGPK